MGTQLLLEEKHGLLKNGLGKNLQRKHLLELRIRRQFEDLKRLEVSMEKHASKTTSER